jgi:dimethylhistidine N-methyltransferase
VIAMTDAAPSAAPAAGPAPRRDHFLADVLEGLSRTQKEIPCKWLYDERGSALFERICDLEEYYPTRTELAIMERHVGAMAGALGPECAVVEYGSGSSLKTQLLLQHLAAPAAYLPVDISAVALAGATARLARRFPDLPLVPVCADFTQPLAVPAIPGARRRVVYFPGSTIGNFHKVDAVSFLARIRGECGPGGALLIGVDLLKDRQTLERAYDDARGVTAAFNLNVLARANRELDADFHLEAFEHRACFDPRRGRIEMHLQARAPQRVRVDGHTFTFARGETIFTESSYKYGLPEFRALAAIAGWRVEEAWTDARAWFAVLLLTT